MKCYVTFCFKAVLLMSFCGWNTNWVIMRGMRCYSCLFRVKTSSKEEGMIALRATVRTEAFIQRSVVPHQRRQNGIYCLNFLKEIDLIWKMRLCFLSKVTIYKTGSFQGSSTRVVVITMLYLFGTHACQTERKFSVQVPLHPYLIPLTCLSGASQQVPNKALS